MGSIPPKFPVAGRQLRKWGLIDLVLNRFYLEDDTISVVEPQTHDPGFPQGRLIHRHKIPLGYPCSDTLPYPCDDAFLTLENLNVGCSVEIYGKVFLITGCNPCTRRFLNRRGTPVPPDMESPLDLATEKRKEVTEKGFRTTLKTFEFTEKYFCLFLQALLPTLMAKRLNIQGCRLVEKGKQFLNNTRRVLRFWGYWDDRCNYLGRLRRFLFLYSCTFYFNACPQKWQSTL